MTTFVATVHAGSFQRLYTVRAVDRDAALTAIAAQARDDGVRHGVVVRNLCPALPIYPDGEVC